AVIVVIDQYTSVHWTMERCSGINAVSSNEGTGTPEIHDVIVGLDLKRRNGVGPLGAILFVKDKDRTPDADRVAVVRFQCIRDDQGVFIFRKIDWMMIRCAK